MIAENVAVLAQVIDVLHPNRASVPKEELKEKLAKTYKVITLRVNWDHSCVHADRVLRK